MSLDAMKQALEVLEEAVFYTSSESWSPSMTRECEVAITAIRAAIEQPRQWQGLTEAEKVNVAIDCGCADVAWMDFADAIEAKLKEKNT